MKTSKPSEATARKALIASAIKKMAVARLKAKAATKAATYGDGDDPDAEGDESPTTKRTEKLSMKRPMRRNCCRKK